MPSTKQPLSSAALLDACGSKSSLAGRLISQLRRLDGCTDQLAAARCYYALVVESLSDAICTEGWLGSSEAKPPAESPPPFHSRTIFPWIEERWNDELGTALHDLRTHLAAFHFTPTTSDPLRTLYHRLIPGKARHAGGEYYTPDWLAEHLLDMVGYPEAGGIRLLDPACGSGTFLIAAIRRLRERCCEDGLSADETLQRVTGSIVGIDLDPLAVLAARANYLLAVSDLLREGEAPAEPVGVENPNDGSGSAGASPSQTAIPIYQGDSILDSFDDLEPFDTIVGNPPWIGWESLSEEYRRATRPLWEY